MLPESHPLDAPPSGRNRSLRAAFRAVEDALVSRTVRSARGLVRTLRLGARADDRELAGDRNLDSTSADRVRVLRWIFGRGGDRLTCQLALSSDEACYELRTVCSVPAADSLLERFVDATVAFARQADIERALVREGWTLESYESLVTERHSMLM